MLIHVNKTPACILVALFSLLIQNSCLFHSYSIKVSGAITINENWSDIELKNPITQDKDPQYVYGQFLQLVLEEPYKNDIYIDGKGPNRGGGILMPDGDVINPDIEMIDEKGNKYPLKYAGARRTFQPIYKFQGGMPSDVRFVRVQLKSAKPIKCKSIYWVCESYKDLK